MTCTKKALSWVHKWEITSDELQVGRSGQKKKPRMARTRSDFLTRSSILSVGGDTDEDDNDGDSPQSPRHYTLPLSSQSSMEAGLGESCFSDSDMVTGSPSRRNRRALCFSVLSNPPSAERKSTDLGLTSNWASTRSCCLYMYSNFLQEGWTFQKYLEADIKIKMIPEYFTKNSVILVWYFEIPVVSILKIYIKNCKMTINTFNHPYS